MTTTTKRDDDVLPFPPLTPKEEAGLVRLLADIDALPD